MPEFSIKVGKKTYKVEASTKKEAETKIMEYVSKTNKKTIKEQEAKKEKSDKQRKAKKRKSDKERKTKKDNQLKDTKGSDMNGYYMKKVMVDYTVNYTDGNLPTHRKPSGEGWEPAGGIAVAPHRGKGVLGTTGRYTWAQAWVQYKYVKTEM